jgi:hypothetical protein
MQHIKLGRWVVRVALTIGVGVAVLGGTFAANAATTSPAGGTVYQLPSHGGLVGSTTGKTGVGQYIVDDVVWT